MTSPQWTLVPNDITTRAELGAQFGGNQQAGIAHSATTPNILIYSDPQETESPGYAYDGWVDDVYQYTGEGKRGDQQLTAGNKALLEHAQTGRALRVFVADGSLPGTSTRRQRYLGEFALDTQQRYFERQARDLDGNTRRVYVFRLSPTGDHIKRLEDANAFTGGSDVVEVGVHEVPTEHVQQLAYEYEQAGTKQARKKETELTDRFELYLESKGRRVARYKITTPGSSAKQFTDLADADARILYEAKGVANRTNIRLALGQVLDYGRYVKQEFDGTELALLLPAHPPADMISLLESLNIGCVVETPADSAMFTDLTALRRCPG